MRSLSWRNFLPRALLLALFAGSELACAYLWLGVASGRGLAALRAPAISWPASLLIMLYALILSRWLLASTISERNAATIVALCACATALLAAWIAAGTPAIRPGDVPGLPDALARTPAADLALLFVAWLWWRSATIARSDLHCEDATLRLSVGAIACALALALGEAVGTVLPPAARLGLVLLFFVCALLAVALARLRDVRVDLGGDETSLLNRGWFGVLGLIIAAILAIALLLGSLALLDARQTLTALLTPLADILFVALYIVLLPIGFLAALAIYALRALIALSGDHHIGEPFSPPPSPGDLLANRHPGAARGMPPALVTPAKWALLGVIAFIVMALIVHAVFRYQQQRERGIEEIHESLWPGGSPWAALMRWLRRLFRRARVAPMLASTNLAVPAARDPTALTVRELYCRWLAAAAARGYPRPPSETADEYLTTGLRIVPGAADALHTLTRTYDRARYGPQPFDCSLPEEARDAWQQIDATLATEALR